MTKRLKSLANGLALTSFVIGSLHWLSMPAPPGYLLWIPKSLAAALSPLWTCMGAAGALLGLRSGSRLAVWAGSLGAWSSGGYLLEISREHPEFERIFGKRQKRIPAQPHGLLRRRWMPWLPKIVEPRWLRDLTYAVLPGSGRPLLCDLWLPPVGVPQTGLAFIYSHGSAWYSMDKDVGTRTFFRHLAAQGHVVMDLQYRLAPETDMAGMVGDIQRAVAWMKRSAGLYGVDPRKVVIGGGSAGGQLSMLAAYAPDNPLWRPEDLSDSDLTVAGVVSEYSPADLEATYDYTHQNLTTRWVLQAAKKWPAPPDRVEKLLRRIIGPDYERLGMNKSYSNSLFVSLLGAHPFEDREPYRRFSPVYHVHPGCPPTLLIQGDHDMYVPMEVTGDLYLRLKEAGVRVANIVLPQSVHGFDLVLPAISPPAQAALYYVEHFLASLE